MTRRVHASRGGKTTLCGLMIAPETHDQPGWVEMSRWPETVREIDADRSRNTWSESLRRFVGIEHCPACAVHFNNETGE